MSFIMQIDEFYCIYGILGLAIESLK